MSNKLVEYMTVMIKGLEDEPVELSQETISGCSAFARAYADYVSPLPVDPGAMLVAYERYQDKLASEAVTINWLAEGQSRQLKHLVREAIRESEGIIGCEAKEAADSMSLWLRGVCNRVARLAAR